MSIFSKSSSFPITDINVPVFEGYNSEFNGDLIAVQEGYEDQLAIIEAIHSLDIADLEMRKAVKVLQESGADEHEIQAKMEEYNTVTEASVSNVWQRIKDFFARMLGKLKAFFGSVIRAFDAMFKSGKNFATKYEKDLNSLDLSGFKYKMFKYTNLNGSKASDFLSIADKLIDSKMSSPGNTAEAIVDSLEKFDDQKEEMFDSLRGSYCGGGNLDRDEYTEALYSNFRDGAKDSEDKEEVSINIRDIIATLKDDKPLKEAEAALTDCEQVFKKQISEISKLEREFQKSADNTKTGDSDRARSQKLVLVAQKQSSAFSEAKTIALEYFRAWKAAVTARNSEYKSVCVAAFRYKKKA